MGALGRSIRRIARSAARTVLAFYEAGERSRLRKFHRARGSQNEMVQRGALGVRVQARHLARNHDISRGIINTLVNNVIGPKGIGVEFQPRRKDGSIHTEYAAALSEAWRDWCQRPEVTWTYSWSKLQRSIARAWFRDGECFGQMITGTRPDLDHGTRVPFSLEVFESDLVPLDKSDATLNIVQGIQRNQWGRRIALHVLKTDPASIGLPLGVDNTKAIPWERVIHVATLDHIGQLRGMSTLASVITRLEDIKDYEESERIAAKIAAMLCAYIKKGDADDYQPPEGGVEPDKRELNFRPGTIFDDLRPGEEVGMLDSKRPNPNLLPFRQGQLRAVAAGTGPSYSSVSKDYNGTYSAQRQELVESWVNYAVLTDDFVGDVLQPVVQTFIELAHLSGVARMPADLKPGTHDDVLYIAQSMPWIDPLKEALGWEALVKAGFASEVEVIRRRGGKPDEVLQQISEFRKKAAGLDLHFSTEAANPAAQQAAQDPPGQQD